MVSRRAAAVSLVDAAVKAMPHVAQQADRFGGGAVHGTGHCVDLVRAACGLPQTAYWRPGAHVLTTVDTIDYGTAIATFSDDGRYGNVQDGSSHAALYLERRGDGIRVLDQWVGRPAGYRVIRDKNGAGPAADDASRFHVVEIAGPEA